MFDPLPRRSDFFPKTRRGHGTMHPNVRLNKAGVMVREATFCVDPTCQLNAPKSKNLHVDTEANLKDWCEEHGLRLKRTTPFLAMLRETSGQRL